MWVKLIRTGSGDPAPQHAEQPGIRVVERVIIVAGVSLRLALAVVNSQANDDHLSTIRIIARQHRLPGATEAWEAFQPKLYHVTVATLWELVPGDSLKVEIRVAQLVSCAAGIATIFVAHRLLREIRVSPRVRVLALAFVVLNPKMIGLSAQATNDAFVILFSTVAVLATWRYLETRSWRALSILTASLLLASISKGNGIVTFAAVVVTLAVAGVCARDIQGHRPRWFRHLVVLVATYVVLVTALGPYRTNASELGSPFAINGPRAPFPHLVDRTYVYRPGITSIVDGYMTFRIVDLMRHPLDTTDATRYPEHRTSLWSQVHGRAHFIHFDQHPPTWRDRRGVVVWLGRVVLVVALVPTFVLILGLLRGTRAVLTAAVRRDHGHLDLRQLFMVAMAWGFIAFLVTYTLEYRDFATMKSEFMLPAAVAFAALFAWQWERWSGSLARSRLCGAVVWGALVTVPVLYTIDVTILIARLATD